MVFQKKVWTVALKRLMVRAIRVKLPDVGHGDKRALYPAPVVLWGPNGIRVGPDTHPNALGKRWGNYLYMSIQKRPVYADKSIAMQLKSEHSF